MKFSRDFLQNMGGTTICDEVTSVGRWSIYYRRVFQFEGRYYATTYSVAATEAQDESPYQDEPDVIDVPEVFPVQQQVTVYEPLPTDVGAFACIPTEP